MPRPSAEITDAELAVLQELWALGHATIRQLTDKLYPAGQASQYATVQKLLERLENKSFVKRDRGQTVHRFCSCVCREELIGRRLRSVATTLCGGSLTPLLMHLLTVENLSATDRQKLRDKIDHLDKTNTRKPAQRKARRGKA
jgi:BlaI family penicillinase repressor